MPEPKKKTTRHKTRIRRSKKIKSVKSLIKCPKCDTMISPHHACYVCGTYKGAEILDVEKRERRRKAKEKGERETTEEENTNKT